MYSAAGEEYRQAPGAWLSRLVARARVRLARRLLHPVVLLVALLGAGQSLAIEVIANSAVPADGLTMRELRAIYTMRLDRWSDGSEIQVFVLPQKHALHQQFCKSVLQALPHQLQAVWYRLVYSGMGRAPTEVSSEQELIERVSQTPGAIGYVKAGYVKGGDVEGRHELSSVQVLSIEAVH